MKNLRQIERAKATNHVSTELILSRVNKKKITILVCVTFLKNSDMYFVTGIIYLHNYVYNPFLLLHHALPDAFVIFSRII